MKNKFEQYFYNSLNEVDCESEIFRELIYPDDYIIIENCIDELKKFVIDIKERLVSYLCTKEHLDKINISFKMIVNHNDSKLTIQLFPYLNMDNDKLRLYVIDSTKNICIYPVWCLFYLEDIIMNYGQVLENFNSYLFSKFKISTYSVCENFINQLM